MWLIQVSNSNTVRLVLVDFDTEAGYDYIFVSEFLRFYYHYII